MFPDDATESHHKDLLSELKVMKDLSPHKHVVRLLACVTKSGEKAPPIITGTLFESVLAYLPSFKAVLLRKFESLLLASELHELS